MYSKKQREQCVLFLDDCFGRLDLPLALRAAGFQVEVFRDHFSRQDGGPEQGVKDPQIIKLCHKNGWVLVTSDKDMQFTHVEEIKKTDLLILATAHNSSGNMSVWVQAMTKLKPEILRLHRKAERPCFVVFSQAGTITTKKQIKADMKTRRSRPREN